MLFVEPRFLFFFAVVFCAYWAIRSHTGRKCWLLAASYTFYAAWDWRFIGLILLSTAVDFIAGGKIRSALASDTRASGARRAWLVASLAANLGILATLKYLNFFADSAATLLQTIGASVNWTTLHITLPVGISFFTFQSMSYTIDIYRGKIEPRPNPLDFALFVAFFPQLVAGPIVRATHFLPQLRAPRRFDSVPLRACLTLFLIGFFKKACISDSLGAWIDPIFADPTAYSASAIVTGTWLYAAQIYGDFSGYSDMAIAVAGLLGFQLPRNFAAPYFSRSITEFWRRWHISLSTWLRDYLYIPLGGNRRGRARSAANLMITMLVGGLWHGASWNFVIWGALHGGALVVHRLWTQARGPISLSLIGPLASALGMLATAWWVGLAWIFFRIDSLYDAVFAARAYVTWTSSGEQMLPGGGLLCVLLLVIHVLCWWMRPEFRAELLPPFRFALAYGAAWSVVIPLVALSTQPFIYFQF